MNIKVSIIEDMKLLGLNEYEIKAYLSLLEQSSVNGYTLSKNSGVPRSKIYEVLEGLKNKGVVFEEYDGKNSIFQPIDSQLLINKVRKNLDNVAKNIEEYIKNINPKEQNDSKLVEIKGREIILNHLKLLIDKATTRIALSIWEEEINDISCSLKSAIIRGVTVKGIYFGKNNQFKELVPHRRIERYLSEKKERYMTITIDSIHMLYGVISREENSKVTWAKDVGFVDISEDYICHDLMVNLFSYQLEENERSKYEEFLDNVRKEYFNFSNEEFDKLK